ncbi:MAG: ThiF family adenylyltransferase [Thermoplasmata archaeon]|nr:ThiF family adenylyltransferase [Thermoplasmata archaeon]
MAKGGKKKNALGLLKGVDAILDCTDNFPTRYLLNEMAVTMDVPLFFASCREMQG